MSDLMTRERLSFPGFFKSGEVPPDDPEQYIAWKYRSMLIDEKTAILELADLRRGRTIIHRQLERERSFIVVGDHVVEELGTLDPDAELVVDEP